MAPENAFPGPLHECMHITEYILKNSQILNFDTERFILAGDSAG